MRDSTSLPSRRTQDGAGSTPEFVFRFHEWLRRGQAATEDHPVLGNLVAVGFICAVGCVNLGTPRRLSLEALYLCGCLLAGWIAGTRAGLSCTVASAVFLFFSEKSGSASGMDWIYVWNSVTRLAAFAGLAWLAAHFGRTSRDLEQRVEQRSARLRQEVEDHRGTSELLADAVQLFREVTDHIADVFWVTDPMKTQVEYVSPGFETVWGQPCSALYASPSQWFEGIHPGDRERVMSGILHRQIRGGYDEEYRVVRSDGALRWVHDRAFPVKDENGAVYRLVGIAEDITERKLTERLLQAERDLGVTLSSTNDLDVALEKLLDIAVQLEGIDCGGVYLTDPPTGELRLRAHRGLSPAFLSRISRYPVDAPEVRLARTQNITYLRHAQIPRNLEAFWGSEGLQALVVVPLRHQGAILGMLNLGSYRDEEIPARTRIGIEMIASQTAGAIARLQAEASLRRSEAHLRTLINSAPIAMLAADAAGKVTFEDGQGLEAMGLKPAAHLGQPAAEAYGDFPLLAESLQRALKGEECSSVLEFASTTFECRFTPLRGTTHPPSGAIAVAMDVTERFRLQRQVLEISDREQARIGQDVHDGLCQQLIGMSFKLASLDRTLSAQQRPEAAAVQKIAVLLDQAIEESRRVSRGLYPVRLATQGLAAALEELAAGTKERYGIPCRYELAGEAPRCDVATATHLYRIAQEAVNNAFKHSGASQITIQLAREGGGILLEVRDNGKGIGSAKPREGGMGMHTMDYRARLIGGNLRLDGGTGGTVVSCHVPQIL